MRQWREADKPLFAAINANADVMEFYPQVLSRAQSDSMLDKLAILIADNGWGFWAIEIKASNTFIGFVGLNEPAYQLPVTPCVEIGWRMDRQYWGYGYATEAAQSALLFAFRQLRLDQVYAFTSVANYRSRAVMERLCMTNMQQNFAHPMLPAGTHLSEHVLYKIDRQRWLETASR